MKPIQGGWKKCHRGHEGYSVEPHLDFCFEHAPPEYKAAWFKRDAELKAQIQKLVDYYGRETFDWIMREMPSALRLPPEDS